MVSINEINQEQVVGYNDVWTGGLFDKMSLSEFPTLPTSPLRFAKVAWHDKQNQNNIDLVIKSYLGVGNPISLNIIQPFL